VLDLQYHQEITDSAHTANRHVCSISSKCNKTVVFASVGFTDSAIQTIKQDWILWTCTLMGCMPRKYISHLRFLAVKLTASQWIHMLPES